MTITGWEAVLLGAIPTIGFAILYWHTHLRRSERD